MTDQTVHPCNAATMHRLGNAATAHGPHPWVVQPGMEPVHCPGTEPPAADRTQPADRIAEAALSAVEAAMDDTLLPAAREKALRGIAAVLPPPMSRPDVLREVEQHVRDLARATFQPYYRSAYATLADSISRMADEAQPAQQQHGEALCQCGHGKAYHGVEYGTPRCRLCPERGEWKWDHAYTTAAEADRIVAYRSLGGRILRCLNHIPPEPDGDFVPVTSDDLPDGGLCTHPDCGADVLIPQPAAGARQDGEA